MPSANPKLEKQASTESVEPIRSAITVIEHKIRNLEKRKLRLESYKQLQNNGKELEPEQKMAVAKYDFVLQLLDNTKDMYKQIQVIANDAAKQQKKMARKEAAERLQQDISKVKEVLLIQEILTSMDSDSIRSDFLAGTNGAIKLTEEDLKYLDSFYSETSIQKQENTLNLQQQVQKVAEHYVAIVEGKQREVVGTTYNKIKEIVTLIYESGYFDRVQNTETAVKEVTETLTTTQITETNTQEPRNEDFGGERHIPQPAPIILPGFIPAPVAAVSVVSCPDETTATPPITIVARAPPVESSYYPNAAGFVAPPQQTPSGAEVAPSAQPSQTSQQAPRINDVIGTPTLFFLQESELDSPDVTSQAQPIVSHIPPPTAPIPTQTFTNQSFTGAPVVPQVIYPHQPPPQDMAHIPGYTNPNPPPPIPMPPSHQQPNLQYNQHQAGFQPPPDQSLSQFSQPNPPFEQAHGQENEPQTNDTKSSQEQDETVIGQSDHTQNNEVTEWSADTESNTNDWNQPDDTQQSQDGLSQQAQQGWGEQRSSGFRGRGNRRGGNSNGYSGRPRTGYQQNGRGGNAGQGSYYRNDNGNYQNGYHQRNWNSTGGNSGGAGGYGSGFKRTGSGSRGGSRNADRDGRTGGQFRGGQQRSGSNRGGYSARGKPQTQQQ